MYHNQIIFPSVPIYHCLSPMIIVWNNLKYTLPKTYE